MKKLLFSACMSLFVVLPEVCFSQRAEKWTMDKLFCNILENLSFKDTIADIRRPAYCNKDFLLGKINYRVDTVLFEKVAKEHTWNKVHLLKPTYAAFKKMYEAALKDDVKLVVISGCRTFNDQQCIWENKWKADPYDKIKDENQRSREILRYVAMPGTSRHHWGTEIDFNSAKMAYWDSPQGKKVYRWLQKNAHKFGFYQPYTPIGVERPYGYQEEVWHWTYLPMSQLFIREFALQITPKDITGFEGSQTAAGIDVIQKWVMGINPQCLPGGLGETNLH